MSSELLKAAVMILGINIYFCKRPYLGILEMYVSSLQGIDSDDSMNVSFKGPFTLSENEMSTGVFSVNLMRFLHCMAINVKLKSLIWQSRSLSMNGP